MSAGRRFRGAVGLLVAIHVLVLLAPFVAPYDPLAQARELPFAPPSSLHFFDADGRFHWRPFVYALRPDPTRPGDYVEERSRIYPLRMFAGGHAYSFFGLFDLHTHLLGVDEPARLFVLGSDQFGRDVLSRLLYGGRLSLFTGLVAASLSMLVGTALGACAGFYGGGTDNSIMRVSELFMALPWLYVLLALRALMPLSIGPTEASLLLVALLGAIGWARPARLVRGVALSARTHGSVEAARSLGATDLHLIRRHVLPQTASVVLTQSALLVPQFVLAEVTLSFLGLGIAEPTPSWGTMLGALHSQPLRTASCWWLLSPAVALFVLFVAYHRLARALQRQPGSPA